MLERLFEFSGGNLGAALVINWFRHTPNRAPDGDLRLFMALSHQPLFFPVPVPILFGSPFVVLLLALRQADLTFYLAVFPVQGQCHTGIAPFGYCSKNVS